jgi:hypothetical protein
VSEPEPRPRQSRWIEIATALVVVLIVVAVAAFYPPARAGLDGARRSIASLLGAADWDGYYLRLDPNALPGESLSPLLLFASGSFPGQGVSLVDPPVFPGRWSPSGDQFAFTSGRRLIIGDRNGALRSLGELLDLTPAGPPVWVNENELVLTMGRQTPLGWWYVRIDASGLLLDQRALPTRLVMESVSPDGRFALARSSVSLELVDLSDGSTARAPDGVAYVGWASDGRVLLRVIRAGLWQLEARHLGAKLGEVLAELRVPFEVTVRGRWIALVERDPSPRSTASIWLTAVGRDARRVVADLASVTDAEPTRDGRYVTFTTGRFDDPKVRTGVADTASGAVTYACETGCAALRLR